MNSELESSQMHVHLMFREVFSVETRYFSSFPWVYEKLETVLQSYYNYLWIDMILTGLYDVIQESVEKETGKTVFNLESCWLHILHDDFRDRCNAARWNIEDSLSCLR